MEAQDVPEASKKQASSSANTVPAKTSKEQSPNDTGVDDDSAKENQESVKSNTAPQARKKGYSQDEAYYQDMNGFVPTDMTYYSYCSYYWNGYPLSEETLKDTLKKQIEYYFSEENLQKDFFMRRRMNSEGFIPVALIASFHRVQAQTQDITKVLEFWFVKGG
ncbi:La-related protein 1 like protein [Argiope bruennichi]|uniref:La-related protein 1 like protein n=1 Tax=Argiope bruennichi TaxID=94029 RepID=A0A8T0FK87_ARGBR|nr:La-related protein 1 like protein [Argiope bruennichi]